MFLPAHRLVRSLNITGNPKYTLTSRQAIYIQSNQALHSSHFAIKQASQQNPGSIMDLESRWQHQVILQ